MATFISGDCDQSEVNFFTSGNYFAPSYSTTWATREAPDTEGITTPVYLQVLETFNISSSFIEGTPPGGTLPGIEIKLMDAVQAIRLSLAEALIRGQWWEVYEDNSGGVYFQKVFDNGSPGKTVELDVRLCIPSFSRKNEVDMVIVHGYKPPPQRYIGPRGGGSPWKDVIPAGSGPINPTALDPSSSHFTVDFGAMVGTCHASILDRSCIKSYRDPLFTDAFGPQLTNPFYDVKAYEDIIAHVSRVKGLPEDPGSAARVTFKFSETTTWYYRPEFPSFSPVTSPADIAPDSSCAGAGIQSGGDITYYKGTIEYSGADYSDRYGHPWPAVIKPAAIVYVGYTIKDVILWSFGSADRFFVFTSPIPEFKRLDEGSQWIYTIKDVNSYEITPYYQPKPAPAWWNLVQSAITRGDAYYKLADGGNRVLDRVDEIPNAAAGLGIIGTPSDFGFLVTDFWVGLLLDRPCVIVTDPGGNARGYCASFHLESAPLIKYEPPAPIAYKHKTAGVVTLGAEEQSEGIQDSDPTTCQDFDVTPLAIMQNLMTGNTVEVSLPFCASTGECAAVAETIFDYQNNPEVQSFTLTCGPDDSPELGLR